MTVPVLTKNSLQDDIAAGDSLPSDDDQNRSLTDPRNVRSVESAPMIQKKIVLLGATGVGKTSLVRRFVQSAFDEKYLTTLGVKVDKKQIAVGEQDVLLMLWDVAGAEEHFAIPTSYIRGAAGYLLVVDGTCPDTVERGLDIIAQVEAEVSRLPFVFVLNKIDLVEDWRLQEADLGPFRARGFPIFRCSARTGAGVEEAFLDLAKSLIAPVEGA
jgi:hypothetical protein